MSNHEAAIGWARAIIDEPDAIAEVAWNGDAATTYRLCADEVVLGYLKIGNADLAAERDRFTWLEGKVAVPRVLGFAAQPRGDWLLTSPLIGVPLNRPEYRADPQRLVGLLVSVVKRFHSLDPTGCPFIGPDGGSVVIHGDACLPNFVFDQDRFVGALDVGELRVGHPEVDLASAVWSLHYNLGPGFGGEFLRKYGWPHMDEATVERFRQTPWKPE